MARFVSALALLSTLAAGCASRPPPRWAEGGAPLALDRARWEHPSVSVDLLPDGRVLIDGDHIWSIDAAGRVVDNDNDPVAILEPEGTLTGQDQKSLGVVGLTNASPPKSSYAWLSVGPDGQVVYFDSEGERSMLGRWTGCQGPVLRTCTLVSHLVTLREYARRSRVGVGVGVGIGVGVGVGIGRGFRR